MKDKEKDLNFEKALSDLEQIVEKLEKGGLSLNDSLGVFERGVTLARFLRAELDKAEKKIEILLKSDKGGLKAAPFSLEDAEGGGGGAAKGKEGKAEAEDEEEDEGEDDDEDKKEEGSAKKKSKGKGREKKADDDSELPF
jgi:exodeoxyribonuclease VII small subunit